MVVDSGTAQRHPTGRRRPRKRRRCSSAAAGGARRRIRYERSRQRRRHSLSVPPSDSIRTQAAPIVCKLHGGDKATLAESLTAIQQTASVILRAIDPIKDADRRFATQLTNKRQREPIMQTLQNSTNQSPEYRNIPISELGESPTNPGERYDQSSLEKVAESIRTPRNSGPTRSPFVSSSEPCHVAFVTRNKHRFRSATKKLRRFLRLGWLTPCDRSRMYTGSARFPQ